MASHTTCEACSSAFLASFSPPAGSATGVGTPESGCYSTEEHFFALPGPNPRYPWLWAGAGPCCRINVASLGGVVRLWPPGVGRRLLNMLENLKHRSWCIRLCRVSVVVFVVLSSHCRLVSSYIARLSVCYQPTSYLYRVVRAGFGVWS